MNFEVQSSHERGLFILGYVNDGLREDMSKVLLVLNHFVLFR